MITLDTSGTLALLDAGDPEHPACLEAVSESRAPLVVPLITLGEIGHFVGPKLSSETLHSFLDDLAAGAFVLDHGEGDLERIGELVERYADLPLDLADAAVIACAERCGGTVLTLDARDFGVVAREGSITLLPADR